MDSGASAPGRGWQLSRRAAALALALALLATAALAAPPPPGGVPPEDPQAPLHRWAWQTWSSEAGLPQISVKSIARDRQGLLWLATENGLARFDGSRFETFDPGNTPALAASWITKVMVDRAGLVWIATLRNLAVYRDGAFLGSADLGEVVSLAEQPDGSVAAGGARLWRAELTGDRLDVQPDPRWDGPVYLLHADGARLWLAAPGGRLMAFARDGRPRTVPLPATVERVHAIARSAAGLWLGTSAGLFQVSGDAAGAVPVSVDPARPDSAVQALELDADGVLWLASYGELYRRLPDGRIDRVDADAAHAFPWIVSMLAEPDGLWLGSQYHGLRHYWQPTVQRLGAEEGLHDPSLWSFASASGRLLVGSNSGVSQWRDGRFGILIPAASLPHPAVYSLLLDRAGQIWVGSRAGLARFDRDGGNRQSYPMLDGVQVNGAVQRPDGRVWLATAAGLMLADGATVTAVGEGTELAGQRVRALAHGADGALWIGAEGGVFRWHDAQFERIVDAGLDGAFVTSVLPLPDGRIAIGSYDRGIAIGGAGQRWRRLTRAAGLPSDTVFNLFQHDGALLVSYADGVYRLGLAGAAGVDDGAVEPEILVLDHGDRPGRSRVRCCNGAGNDKGVIHQGALWLPSLNGAVRVPLSARMRPPPTVDIVAVRAASQVLAPANLQVLPRGVRELEVTFRAIDYRDAGQLAFRYRLDGFDAHWLELAGRPQAAYAHLRPGRYRFEVQARRLHQPWGGSAGFDLVVPRLFVEGWLFRLLLAAAALGAVALLVRWRLHRLQLQKLALEGVVLARTRELADANAKLEGLNRSLAEASVIDPLTGLRNRRFLPEQIPRLLAAVRRARDERQADLVLGLILVDADRFKQINDGFGHITGDQVLCRMSAAMRGAVRDGDELVRWGGEEFLVVLPCLPRAELMLVAERIRTGIADCPTAPGQPPCVTASLGVSAWPIPVGNGHRHDWTVALDLADFALYRAKDAGRNRSAMLDLSRLSPSDWPDRPDAACLQAWLAEGRIGLVIMPGTTDGGGPG
jgi:diguanylate cyclase (GGDEF)-like protein